MTIIIAEAGVNHNGDENLAFELVNAAHKAGADIVKFQTFKAKQLTTAQAEQAAYQTANTELCESQLSMLSRLELSYDAHLRLAEHCRQLGIEFLSTAFDHESLHFLVNEVGLERLKIPSGELTNAPLLLEHARNGHDLIISTGMASLADIEMALQVVAFGLVGDSSAEPSIAAFQAAYSSPKGQEALCRKVTLLHCTTEYPAPYNEVNLNAMNTLHQAFNLPIGYSDHTQGIAVPIAAVAKGATIIEKHFTLDRSLPGPDHKASLEPHELTDMVTSIRTIEQALGSTIKTPSSSEIKNQAVARKSLVATQSIKVGELFTEDNIGAKRPGGGKSPYQYWATLGQAAQQAYEPGDLIVD